MSHTLRVKKVPLDDTRLIKAAVDAIEGAHFVAPDGTRVATIEAATGTHQLYGGAANGVGIKLPEWNYPVVVDPATGEARYDNYGGSWGQTDHLDHLVQQYSAEKTRTEAMMANLQLVEETVDNEGVMELTFEYIG